ncbi:MAG TPA: hypothetical protein VFT16_01860 [Candidatus Saccharimonadales bacterium]|nr:hypothetical protein [Candidatus Saccharimonadales bacterium]
MNKLPKRISLALAAFLILFTSVGISSFAFVQEASAASCSDSKIWFNRARWCGYFKNKLDMDGLDVRNGGVPARVNTATEFINMIKGDLSSGNAHRITGAQFVILTMIGRAAGTPKSVSAAQLADWEARVRTYANISENGTTSYGNNGRIDWNAYAHWPCGTRNTFYQDDRDDVAPYLEDPSNGTCENGSVMDAHIYFRNASGGIIYVIRRACMNPLGAIGPLSPNPEPNFNLNPIINATVNGAAGTSAQVGDTVSFSYVVSNTGTTASDNTACSTYRNTYTGYRAANPTPSPGGAAGPNPGCPRDFGVGSTTVATESFVVTTANQTHCRSLFVNPATWGGGQRGREVCVIIASQPYLKVFGGDISAGGGLESGGTCTNNANAAVISWNKRAAGAYAGAGAQYAVVAMDTITDFSSALGNAGGAPKPAGLSLANTTTNVASGNFGGNFDAANCIANYWGRKPATTKPMVANVSTMTTGAYAGTGNVTLAGGNVNPGQRISVYIDGNLYLTGNITYPGSWSASNMPLLDVVVRGNIYISGAVTRMDGVFISQRNASTGGTIYTCASGFSAPTLTAGAFYNSCTNKLTVNGAFIANSVEFLRTAGTLQQSNAGETTAATGTGNNAGEVFNFNPSLWMVQPSDTNGSVDNYDAITSLPPVL